MPRRIGLGAAVLLLAAGSLFGQSQNATLDGQVIDKSGASVPGAAVTITNAERAVSSTVQSDNEGRFSFPNLAPGTYDLNVVAKGFQTYVQHGIQLLANQSARVDATLDVGEASTKIEVTADAAQLNYDNGAQQEGVPPQIVNQLPLEVASGTPRNAVQFLSFLPGVNTGTSPQAFNARINGGLKMGDEAIMDGVSMQEGTMSQSGMVSFFDFPTTPDMVNEVRVLTSSYEPEYGVTTGGEIIVTTRSGTDQFHGGGFEYFRNKVLNALSYTNPRPPGDQRPKDNENEFGGFIGGPVKLSFLPFVWGAKHKTYFFHDEEYLRSLGGTNRPLYSIPSMQERNGDFSDLGIPIYDPYSVPGNPRSGFLANPAQRQPYPGNKIPVSEQSPLAQQWFKYLPTPTSSGPYNNFLGFPTPDGILASTDLFLYKIDHYWGEKDHFFVTIWRQKNPPNEQCALPVMICTSSPAKPEDAWVNRFNWDHNFTPTFLSHFAVGYVNRNEGYGSVSGQNPAELPHIPNAAAYFASPAANFSASGVSNLASWGNTAGPGYLNKTTRPSYITNELLTWVRGAHTIKFGGEFRHLQQVFRQNGNQSGTVGFSDKSTGIPGVASGDPFASMYIGAVDNGGLSVYNVSKYGAEQLAFALHIGDTWKVKPKLSLNYGLRWDKFTPTFETSNQLSFFSFADNPGAGNRPGSLAFAGSKWGSASYGARYPETPFNGGIAPRLGLAYQVTPETVVRAGYGIFYTQAFYPGWGGGMSLDGFNPSISFADSQSGYQPAFNLDTGFPAYSRAPDISATADNGKGGPNYRPLYANHLSYTQQWNLTVERKLGNSAIASVAYVGNKGTHLPSQMQPLNYLNPSLLTSLGAAKLNTVFTPGQPLFGVSEPYSGWAAQLLSVGTCQPTLAQALVMYPQYCNGLIGENENEGTSMYNSFQAKIEKQFSGGLYLGANYTFARLMTDASSSTQATAGYGAIGAVINPFQGSRNYALSPDDITHTFALIGTYDLPFGPGKRWLSSSGFLSNVVGGWILASSVKLVSGMPLYFRDSAVCGVPSQFQAQCIPAITDPSKVLAQSWPGVNVNEPMYNAAAFESSTLFAKGDYLGTGPRVSSVRGSPYRDTNLSLSKKIVIKEKLNIEVRAEAFNVFNNHYFTCDGQAFGDCVPFNNDPSSTQFGVWNGTVTAPRNVQLVGRITF
ncbi:MAG TPA: carboxypeptidase-like regulatory domain-containing protein [Bryobacteraceae bacterium]|nr:carboxypeptidase-like regulatory domain-containing protein [Bryobacteraceae bacterium]